MVKCAVVGGSGYIGGELVRLLLGHPNLELVAVTANEAAGRALEAVHPNLAGTGLVLGELTAVRDAEVLFLALPNGETMKVVNDLPDRTLVDTSADFRLHDEVDFARYYKASHACFGRVGAFTYGLPELFRPQIREASHLASPGCFATAAILSIYPLVAEGLDEHVVINAVTGSSGSGIKPKERAHHPFRADSYFAYETFTHRHLPEIRQALRDRTGREVGLVFQPHSGPFARGIFATAVVTLGRAAGDGEIAAIYREYYSKEPFVRLVDASPNVKWVRGTNFCDISVHSDGRTAIVTAAIDNLLKGGAAQAVQSFNIMSSFDETAGLHAYATNP
jgi:N-acetyl-gamma-glutamyl-phosphate/LysW-gamma-L-alpha-aminoadipyl-6-phosphate reductase